MSKDINIRTDIQWDKVSCLLKTGIAGALINLAGDMLAGWGVRDMSLPGIEGLVSHYLLLSDRRIFWSAMLGLVGVPVSAVGHIGVYKLLRPYSRKYARLCGVGIFAAFTFGGSGVHMSSLASAFFYKYMNAASPQTALTASIKFACYFSLPLYAALLLCMTISTYAQIRALATGLSPFPRWCWVFSLPVGALLVSPISLFGNHAVVNAIAVGVLSLGNIWMLGGQLLMLGRVKEKRKKPST
ncbi:MAG: hypothetical protein QM296_10405 [Bacillota bacterium]|nr:hypothetical protein [Bacillota bacterium]